MAQSRLIELSYFDPHTSIRLTTYADTIVTDYSSPNRIISAVRFGGYPEVVKAMSDAIYGGATIDVCSNGETLHLDTLPRATEGSSPTTACTLRPLLWPTTTRNPWIS